MSLLARKRELIFSKSLIKIYRLIATVFLLFYATCAVSESFIWDGSNGTLAPSGSVPLALGSTDSLTTTAGSFVMETPNGDNTAYTVATTGGSNANAITINSGSTMSYAGSNANASTITTAVSGNYALQLIVNGTLNKGTGLNALLVTTAVQNSSVEVSGSIIGPCVLTPGGSTTTLDIIGSSASIDGAITGSSGSGNLNINLGTALSPVNFTVQGAISNPNRINLDFGTLIVSAAISGVKNQFNINNGTTATFNSTVSLATGASFTNAGDLNIASTFTPSDYTSFTSTSGDVFVIGSGNITGELPTVRNLTVGENSSGSDDAASWTTSGNLNVSDDMRIAAGTFVLSGGNSIAAALNSFTVDSGATANILGTLNGTGATVTNSGAFFLGSTGAINTTGLFTNNADLNLAATFSPASFTNTNGSIYIIGNLASLPIALTAGVKFHVGSDSTGATSAVTFSTGNTISGIPVFRVFDGSTFSIANSISGVSTSFTVDSGATTNVNEALGGTGTLLNNGTLNLNTTSLSLAIQNQSDGQLNISGNTSTTADITNAGNIQFSSSFASTANFTSTGTIVFASGTNNSADISSSGTFTVSSNSTNTGALTNTGTMQISAQLSGAGSIANNSGGRLSLLNNANVANSITNAGTMTTTGSTSVSNAVTSSGRLTIDGTLNMAGQTLSNSGTATSIGAANLTAANYNITGTHQVSVTGATTGNFLTLNGTADFTGGSLEVIRDFTLTPNVSYSWDVFSATTLNGLSLTNISLPSDSLETWTALILNNTVTITAFRTVEQTVDFITPAQGILNREVASVLQSMVLISNPNPGQAELLRIMKISVQGDNYNSDLHKLIPNQNYSQQSIQLQNSVFSRAESRLAALQSNYIPTGYGSVGYAAGDIYYDTAVWAGGFGSATRQRSRDSNEGYKAGAAGFLFGVDHINASNNIFGIAFGSSNSNIDDNSNPNFTTKVIGYHALAYAGCNLYNNKFYEWVLTGTINQNRGTRAIDIADTNLTTTSSYNNYQFGARINYGKHCDLTPCITWTPIAMLQYGFINKPTYVEEGSVAALQVQQKGGQNILTIGAGSRLSFATDNWWVMGSREFRAMVTYDVVSPDQDTVSRFAVGSSDFIITSTPARVALKLGVDFGFQILSCVTLQLSYDYEVRQDFNDHTGMLKVKYLF